MRERSREAPGLNIVVLINHAVKLLEIIGFVKCVFKILPFVGVEIEDNFWTRRIDCNPTFTIRKDIITSIVSLIEDRKDKSLKLTLAKSQYKRRLPDVVQRTFAA